MIIFLLGMLGALAPEIVRLYTIRSHPHRFRWSRFYIVVSILFSILGGVIAVVLPATTLWGAVYVGVSTPMLVNGILKKGVDARRPRLRNAEPPAQLATPLRSFVEAL